MAALINFGGREFGRGRGGYRRGRGRGWGGSRGGPREQKPIPEAEIEPLKVFVGNLRDSVTTHDLKTVFSTYVKVVQAFTVKDKITKRSKGYGFVQVTTPQEVQKLLELKDGDTYIHGQSVSIKPARKRTVFPGDDYYVRIPLSDRPFDLESAEPSSPCIHILVDDVLFKILEELPMKALIGVERVCRRWQMVVYKLFAKHHKLTLSRDLLGMYGPLSRPIISKLLILAGPTLKDLKVQNVNYCAKNILRIISQLCPGLERLDVTRADGINYSNLKYLTNSCKNLKGFCAEECPDFDCKALREVLSHYPELESLNIGGWLFDGRDFNLLPAALKEMKISYCTRLKKENLRVIGDRCPNLEVLEMDQIDLDKSVIEHIGTHCTELKELKLCVSSRSCAEALQTYKELKRLHLEAEDNFEIFPAIQHMSKLEYLTMRGGNECLTQSDRLSFAVFKQLRSINLIHFPMTAKTLSTLAKCINLRSVEIRSCSMTSSILLDILRGCPQIEKIWTPDVDIQQDLLNSINDIMKPRTGPLSLALCADTVCLDISECQYDSKKIKLDMSASLGFMMDDDYDVDYDYDNDSLFSGESFDDEYCWMYGYDSDTSLPEACLYGDNIDFLERHLGLFNFNYNDSDDEYLFE